MLFSFLIHISLIIILEGAHDGNALCTRVAKQCQRVIRFLLQIAEAHNVATILDAVQDSVRAGVDVVSFSGDKLLGGPQAGIIVGKKTIVDSLKKHPLTRAMRVDKMTLAALEATLRSYDAGLTDEIPTLAMLGITPAQLRNKADHLCAMMTQKGISAEVVSTEGQVGGGSVPTQMLKSFAVAVQPAGVNLDQLETNLRLGSPAIIGRINHDRFLLDVRTLRESDFAEIVEAVAEAER